MLEWAPRGSLAGLLEGPGGGALRWEDPLLKIAMDVARGMAYLHGCEFVDEATGESKR